MVKFVNTYSSIYVTPVFYGILVCWYKNSFDIDTGMNKIPSYQYYTGILPSSIGEVACIADALVYI